MALVLLMFIHLITTSKQLSTSTRKLRSFVDPSMTLSIFLAAEGFIAESSRARVAFSSRRGAACGSGTATKARGRGQIGRCGEAGIASSVDYGSGTQHCSVLNCCIEVFSMAWNDWHGRGVNKAHMLAKYRFRGGLMLTTNVKTDPERLCWPMCAM